MRKQVLAVTVGVLLVLSVFSVLQFWQIKPAQATTIFSSGFEEGQFNPSPGVWSANSSATVQSTIPNSGSYAANFTCAAWGGSYAYVYVSDGGATCFLRKYFYFAAMPTTLTRILVSEDYSSNAVAQIYVSTTTLRLVAQQPTTVNHDYSTTFASATWYYLELKFLSASSPTGEYRVYIGSGTEVITATNLNTAGAGDLRYIQVGVTDTEQAVEEYVDDVAISNSFNGPLAGSSGTVLSVSLNSPASSALLQNGTIDFAYTPITYGSDIQNSSLWTNKTSSWAETQGNATAITNNTQNIISYSAWPALDTIEWNIKGYNTTDYVFATANFTFTFMAALPYNYSWIGTSQIRGVFYSATSSMSANWDLVASTLAPFGINLFDIEVMHPNNAYFPNPYVGYSDSNISGCIAAFHAYNIAVYAHIDAMIVAPNASLQCYYLPYGSTYPTDNVSLYNWLDIANPVATTHMKQLVQYMITNYAFDGMFLDYVRWDDDMPYGAYDFAQFKTDTGLDTGVSWSTWLVDVLPPSKGGNDKYYAQFMDWRANLITAYVGNISAWALEINPDLKFSAAVSGYGYDGMKPDYSRWGKGQDFTNWIRLGYINWVSPMLYNSYTVPLAQFYEQFGNATLSMIGNATGVAHGFVPMCPFLTLWVGGGTAATTTNFVNQVNAINGAGGDGWVIWCYAGPGSTNIYGYPDIREYLNSSGLNLPSPTTFSLENVTVTVSGTNATVSWQTSAPTNSTIEYNTPPALYAWSLVTSYQSYSGGFQYWQCTHYAGTTISNSTTDTTHSFNLSGLTAASYVYQIWSADASGTAFTSVLTFTMSETGASVTMTIYAPTNSTYSSGSTVPVNFTASGGTIDQMGWNCTYNNGTIAYANQTYTIATTMTLAYGTYIINCWANDTSNNIGVATIIFSVSAGGTTSIIINVWWSSWW